MRHFDLNDLLDTWSTELGIDRETLRLQIVDLSRAIVVLREAGGRPTSLDDAEDTADALYRLVLNMTLLAPFRGRMNDQAAAAAARRYARNRGYDLRLRDGGENLAQIVEGDGLDPVDIRRAYRTALHPNGLPVRCPEDLTGTFTAISHAMSEPSPDLRGVCSVLRDGANAAARALGAQVLLPHEREGRDDEDETLFTESIERVLDSQLRIIIGDPKSQGCAVEREWSFRLGIPVIEFIFGTAMHPHRDGPDRLIPIHVDIENPQAAVDELRLKLAGFAWAAQDQRAVAASYEIKNAEELAHVRGTWDGLDDKQKRALASRARMSVPYITGLLHSGHGLELASDEQRRALELALKLHNHRLAAMPRRLGKRDMDLIGDACAKRGVSPRDSLEIAARIEADLAQSRVRGQLRGPVDAQARVDDIIRELRIKRAL